MIYVNPRRSESSEILSMSRAPSFSLVYARQMPPCGKTTGKAVSTWFYLMSPNVCSPSQYRLDIWERERWAWPVTRTSGQGRKPEPGDLLLMFFSEAGEQLRFSRSSQAIP
ncbi:MAG TPA: hypothetical protein VFZ54_18175 [Burkholderiales bacterium]